MILAHLNDIEILRAGRNVQYKAGIAESMVLSDYCFDVWSLELRGCTAASWSEEVQPLSHIYIYICIYLFIYIHIHLNYTSGLYRLVFRGQYYNHDFVEDSWRHRIVQVSIGIWSAA